MSSSQAGGFRLPLPGSPESSVGAYTSRMSALLKRPDAKIITAFWLFGLINNVLYVIILSAAQDLVGTLPKGIVLLADVAPSFATKLVAPYFIHRVPYRLRVLIICGLSAVGMAMVALTPAEDSVAVKMVGVVLASIASGLGELSFLGLTHYYGTLSLAGWGSGTGAAGLVGAGLYVVLTDWLRFSVRASLLFSATLPAIMLISFFVVLPHDNFLQGQRTAYAAVPETDDDSPAAPAASLLVQDEAHMLQRNLQRAKKLVIPYMLPLLLVYIAEYTINQGVAPTLLFPLDRAPFSDFREFYPFYAFLYQLGVFISRSSTPFVRIHMLYVPSFLQIGNLLLLLLHAYLFFLPSVYIVFIIIFWEGLLGGAVYVNCFAEIMEKVPEDEREFSLSATTVSDSAGICIAGIVSIFLEPRLCNYQAAHGRGWCKEIKVGH